MSTTQRLLAVCLLLAAVPGLRAQFREPARTEVRAQFKAVDTAKGTVTVTTGPGRDTPAKETTYALAKEVEVAIGGDRGLLFKAGKLADLNEGLAVQLALSADQKAVVSILVEPPLTRGTIKAVDAKKKTLTVLAGAFREPGEDKTYTVADDAEIALDDGRGKRFSIKEGKLADLTEGLAVTLRHSLDRKEVQGVHAEGPTQFGTVKAIDAAKRTLTLETAPGRGDDAAKETTLSIATDALVVLDDGTGRRLSLREAKLAEVPVGAAVVVKLAIDQTHVSSLRASGPNLGGLLKAVDADKGTITVAFFKGREPSDEKTYTLSKGGVVIDGNEAPLAQLKVADNGPFVQVRLSLDQKSVQLIMTRGQ